MKIFEKRPLCLILCIMLGGFSFFALSDIEIKLSFIGVGAFILGISFIRGIFSLSKIKLIRICSACFIISLLLSILWQTLFFPNKFNNKAAEIEAQVLESNDNENYTVLIAKTYCIDNEKHDYTFKIYLYDQQIFPASGDVIRFTAEIRSLSSNSENESTYYMIADGISATCHNINDLRILRNEPDIFNDFLSSIRKNITKRLNNLTNEETGGFISALLIGDRTHLDDNTNLLFRRIGLSHILALSGMHLSIITHAILKILSSLRFRKKISLTITIVFTLIYMALVGFTPSITRSGIMLIVCYLLFLIARTHDSFTSLAIAVFIIVLFSPCSIFDISLWLSAFATLGILCFAEITSNKLSNKRGIALRLATWFINSILASVFAVGCTLIFSIFKFSTFSVLSIFSTIVFTPIIELFIYAGSLLLLFGQILPFGNIIILFATAIKHLADCIAELEWSLCSSDFLIVKVLAVVFTALLFSFFIFDVKRKRIAIALMSILLISVYLSGALLTSSNKNTNSTIYSSADIDNNIFIKSQGESTVIMADTITTSSSYDILNMITEDKLTYLDNLILCDYNNEISSIIPIIINNIMVKYIHIPIPSSDAELMAAEDLASLLSRYSSTLRFIKFDESLTLGQYTFTLLYRSKDIENKNSECVFSLKEDTDEVVYFSRSAHLTAPKKVREAASNAHTIIIGSGSGNDKFNLYFDNIVRIICRDEKYLDTDLLNYIKSKETTELLFTKKIRLK